MARKKNGRELPQAPVMEEVEGTKGMGIDGGISIATFLCLLGAISLIWFLISERYPVA